jgi:hypothetical protein
VGISVVGPCAEPCKPHGQYYLHPENNGKPLNDCFISNGDLKIIFRIKIYSKHPLKHPMMCLSILFLKVFSCLQI